MRGVFWVAVLAVASWTTGVQAGFHGGLKLAVWGDWSLEQRFDQLGPATQAEARRPPVRPVNHDWRPQRRAQYMQPRGPSLFQGLFGPRRYIQPRTYQRAPARVAPHGVRRPARTVPRPGHHHPHANQSRPRSAALVPRPAPGARLSEERTVAPEYLPTFVDYESEHEPGTIVIDPTEKFLYLVQENGKARRYGIGVGREGFGWSGTVRVGRKAEWPTWTPPKEMIRRQPWLAKYSGGMPGGPDNPLGARALYLYDGDRDTLYRIHGSNEPWTIGQSVSSGCFRMRNEDVTELFEQIPIGTKVVVL